MAGDFRATDRARDGLSALGITTQQMGKDAQAVMRTEFICLGKCRKIWVGDYVDERTLIH